MTASALLGPAPIVFAALVAIFALGRFLRPLNTAGQTRGWLAIAMAALTLCVSASGLFLTAERLSAKEAPRQPADLRASSGAILIDCATGQHYLMGPEGPARRVNQGGHPVRGGDLVDQTCR